MKKPPVLPAGPLTKHQLLNRILIFFYFLKRTDARAEVPEPPFSTAVEIATPIAIATSSISTCLNLLFKSTFFGERLIPTDFIRLYDTKVA